MKRKAIIIILFFLGFTLFFLKGQDNPYNPKGFSYQAVARDENGLEMKNKDIKVRISIIPDDPANNVEYSETHNVKTDVFGLFNIIIGQGTYYYGDVNKFCDINWVSGPHFFKVEVDFGNGYQNMGVTQLLAVPYAMHSGTATKALKNTDDQKIRFNLDTKILTLEDGDSADLKSLSQHTLEINGSNLSISPGGNTVNIKPMTIAFRAFRSNGGSGNSAGSKLKLDFADIMNQGNAFNNGTFTVPEGGAGLYFFELTYKFDGNQNLSIYKNGSEIEKIYDLTFWSYPVGGICNFPFILDLKENDTIEIWTTFINYGSTTPGIFMGYRIN